MIKANDFFDEDGVVTVDGDVVPQLRAGRREKDGKVWLSLDNRFGADFDNVHDAFQAAWLIANAIAIGAGFPSASIMTLKNGAALWTARPGDPPTSPS